jgi:hypothetical protein
MHGEDVVWRPSNAMQVMNADIAGQLELSERSARMAPRARADEYAPPPTQRAGALRAAGGHRRHSDRRGLTDLAPSAAVAVDPGTVRQVFNDTDREQLWLIVGTPRDRLTPEDAEWVYPDGREALPPELSPES